jgi:hypothetical protein
MTKTQRARITTSIGGGHVTISYTDAYTGERVTRTFGAPTGREGYVVELDGRGGSRQVCDCLDRVGNTLMSSAERLAETIRREYRAMRRAEKSLERARANGRY